MVFIRVKKRGDKYYYYLVENSRFGDRIKQTCLKYIGTTKPSDEEFKRIVREMPVGQPEYRQGRP